MIIVLVIIIEKIFPTIVTDIKTLDGNFILVTSPTFDIIAMAPPVIHAVINVQGKIPDNKCTINGKSPTSPLGLLMPTPNTNQNTAACNSGINTTQKIPK